jgi:HEAT repeat protein
MRERLQTYGVSREYEEFLRAATADADGQVRYRAYIELRRHDRPKTLELAMKRVAHPSPEVRRSALDRLAAEGDKRALEPLLEDLAKGLDVLGYLSHLELRWNRKLEAALDEHPAQRVAVRLMLSDENDDEVFEELAEVLASDDEARVLALRAGLRHADDEVFERAMDVAAACGGDWMVPEVMKVFWPNTRRPGLARCLHGSRKAAFASLEELLDRELAKPGFHKEQSRWLRVAIFETISRIGGPGTRVLLKRATNDPSEQVRQDVRRLRKGRWRRGWRSGDRVR